jgi:hypothetical protein
MYLRGTCITQLKFPIEDADVTSSNSMKYFPIQGGSHVV